jgi:hypothetical protein
MNLRTLAAIALISAGPAAAQSTSCKVTLTKFEQLRDGMLLEEAEYFLGCKGVLLSSSSFQGTQIVMFQWDGYGMLGANMNAMFENRRLVMKAQMGLKN